MACGAAVVASDIGGITEVVGTTRENGLLVPPGDVAALTGAMRVLSGSETHRRLLGEAARRRVAAQYTAERMVESTLEAYGHAIALAARTRV
jgi:glycosyltransferase involved in cell wall biosynthesis